LISKFELAMTFQALFGCELLLLAYLAHIVLTAGVITRSRCSAQLFGSKINALLAHNFEATLLAAWNWSEGALGACRCSKWPVDCAGIGRGGCWFGLTWHGEGALRTKGFLLMWIPRAVALVLALATVGVSCAVAVMSESTATVELACALAVACSAAACVQLWAVCAEMIRRCCAIAPIAKTILLAVATGIDQLLAITLGAIGAGVAIDTGYDGTNAATPLVVVEASLAIAIALVAVVVANVSLALTIAVLVDERASRSAAEPPQRDAATPAATIVNPLGGGLDRAGAGAGGAKPAAEDEEDAEAQCGVVAWIKEVERSPFCRYSCAALCCYRCERTIYGPAGRRGADAGAAPSKAPAAPATAAPLPPSRRASLCSTLKTLPGRLWAKLFRYHPFRRSLGVMLFFCTIEELLFAFIPEFNSSPDHDFAINILADVAITLEDAKLLLGLLPAHCCGVQLGISMGVSALQMAFVFSISSAGIIPPWLGLALLHLEMATEAMLLLHMSFLAPYEHEELGIVPEEYKDAEWSRDPLAFSRDEAQSVVPTVRRCSEGGGWGAPPSLCLQRRLALPLTPSTAHRPLAAPPLPPRPPPVPCLGPSLALRSPTSFSDIFRAARHLPPRVYAARPDRALDGRGRRLHRGEEAQPRVARRSSGAHLDRGGRRRRGSGGGVRLPRARHRGDPEEVLELQRDLRLTHGRLHGPLPHPAVVHFARL
jgi:hypothetical protein